MARSYYSYRNARGQFARYNEELERVVKMATKLGEEACQYAWERRGYYKPETEYEPTFNIVDSIGSAVYVDGVLRPETKRYVYDIEISQKPYIDKGWGGTGGPMTGREALERYWQNNQTLPTKGKNVVEIVCIAATFYAGILEKWINHVQVISAAADYLASIQQDPRFADYKPRLNMVDSGRYQY